MGREDKMNINPGLGISVAPSLGIIKKIRDSYNNTHFLQNDKIDETTIVKRVTQILQNCGLSNQNEIQNIAELNIYPAEYFCPEIKLGKAVITKNTHSIHWYSGSWLSPAQQFRAKVKKVFGSRIYDAVFDPLKKVLKIK
ncbi:MAG: hypothetical protein LBE13_20220 [Bacteroidales bacterium]|jgi:hypothetical protein|nr:hypothetical protein [Bacteroidales bacterium]